MNAIGTWRPQMLHSQGVFFNDKVPQLYRMPGNDWSGTSQGDLAAAAVAWQSVDMHSTGACGKLPGYYGAQLVEMEAPPGAVPFGLAAASGGPGVENVYGQLYPASPGLSPVQGEKFQKLAQLQLQAMIRKHELDQRSPTHDSLQ